MENSKVLSICIPTRERPIILKNTLDSIYNDNISLNKFEVVIYDSSDNLDTKNLVETYKHENLIYIHGQNKKYLNLIESLKHGSGRFLKLHNDYTEFKFGSLDNLINYIEINSKDQPVLFFTNSEINSIENEEYDNFDSFLIKINYLCTWSTMFGIWKSDFDLMNTDSLNEMFPHTDLLLDLTHKKRYHIINKNLFINNAITSKGGYDLFYTFSVTFLKLLTEKFEKNNIAQITYKSIRNNLLNKFLIIWYSDTVILPNQYTFIKKDIKSSILTNYSYLSYIKLLILAHLRASYFILLKIKSIIFNGKK